MKRLDFAPFMLWMWKNATCLRDHFAQYDFKKSPPSQKFAMKLYGSFNVYPYLSHVRSQNFAWHLLCLLTTEGKNIAKLLAISQTCRFQFFFTDLPRNFWKIARLLSKIKNTVTLRFISLYFLSKKSSSERTCPYWQWIVFTVKIKG